MSANMPATAFIGLGSNLGDAVRNVIQARELLQQFAAEPIVSSSLWRSEPIDCPPGSASFVNAIVCLVPLPGLTPLSLLRELQRIEKDFGRAPKKVLNEPRPLDLDLISFGDAILATPELVLPHPRAHQRRFVLEPLAEIEPELVLPGFTRTVQQLLDELGAEQSITRVATLPPQ